MKETRFFLSPSAPFTISASIDLYCIATPYYFIQLKNNIVKFDDFRKNHYGNFYYYWNSNVCFCRIGKCISWINITIRNFLISWWYCCNNNNNRNRVYNYLIHFFFFFPFFVSSNIYCKIQVCYDD